MNHILHLLIAGIILSCMEVGQANSNVLEYFPEFVALRDQVTKLASGGNRPNTVPGCQSGNHNLGYGWGRGKSKKYHINFAPAFSDTPVITTGITHIDATKDENIRIDTKVSNLNRNGFDLLLRSWDVSVLYELKLDWMACPKQIHLKK